MKDDLRSAHRAIASGCLFDGLLDCYVTEDGLRVISQRGLLRALTSKTPANPHGAEPRGVDRKNPGDLEANASAVTSKTSTKSHGADPAARRGADWGNLRRYLARLPERFRDLAEAPPLGLTVPGTHGNVQAIVRDVEWVSALFNAYVEASLGGELHPSQLALARNAHALQKTASAVGWRGLVDECTGYQQARPPADLQRYFARLLRFNAGEWQCTFTRSFAIALSKLLRGRWDGVGAYPQYLAGAFGFTYDCLLGTAAAAELRRLNPAPKFGSNHHQFLQDESRALLRGDLALAEAFANQSATYEAWRSRMRAHFLGEPLQMRFC